MAIAWSLDVTPANWTNTPFKIISNKANTQSKWMDCYYDDWVRNGTFQNVNGHLWIAAATFVNTAQGQVPLEPIDFTQATIGGEIYRLEIRGDNCFSTTSTSTSECVSTVSTVSGVFPKRTDWGAQAMAVSVDDTPCSFQIRPTAAYVTSNLLF